jgi:hypothetical protein
LKEFVDHSRVVGLILFWYRLRLFVGVPEHLDALQDLVLHVEFIEIHLKWIEGLNAGDAFLGSW